MRKYYLIFFLIFSGSAFSENYIQPIKYCHQEEILINGGSVVVSNKINSVQMYQTSKTIKNGLANFHFIVINKTNNPINFYFSSLQVMDQCGRPLKVASKKELIENKKCLKKWSLFGSMLSSGAKMVNAQNAGKVYYKSNSNSSFNSHSHGLINSSVSEYASSTTTGAMEIEAFRQQAERQVLLDARHQDSSIEANYADFKYALNNFYFDSTTVFPGTAYAANFQIEIDRKIEKELQYVFFTYQLGGEEHTFCFFCGEKKRSRW